MREAYPPHVRWHKSSHSSASGQYVEVAPVAGARAWAGRPDREPE